MNDRAGDPFCVRAPPSLTHLSDKMRDAYFKWKIKNDEQIVNIVHNDNNAMDVDEHADNDKELVDNIDSEERKEVKILLILSHSDRKEVTFQVPYNCTIEDLIDELVSNFTFTTTTIPQIQFISDPSVEIDYIMDFSCKPLSTMETDNQLSNVGEDSQKSIYTQEMFVAEELVSETPCISNCILKNTALSITSSKRSSCSKRSSRSQEPKRLPKRIAGILAICPFCKMSTSDFNYCMRCKQKLPQNIEKKPMCSDMLQKENTKIGNSSQNVVAVGGDDLNVNDHTILIYPPPPERGGITIKKSHLECLAEGEFLNDIIIEFYLKYLVLEVLCEKDRRRIHFFSTYFYTRLTNVENGYVTSNQSKSCIDYSSVQRWTKNVNIFEKDYLIVPINKDKHWFLAIICSPALIDGTQHYTTEEKNGTFILIFDSLLGCVSSRKREIRNLNKYLRCEYREKIDKEKKLSKRSIKSACPKVPQQSNGTDCGLFMLQYIESFILSPIDDFNPCDGNLQSWFDVSVISKKRKEISYLIKSLCDL